jgi:hypothetical protein
MPVNRRPGEKKEEFVARCVAKEIDGGMNGDQAVAVCNAFWEEKQLSAVKKIRRGLRKEKMEHFEKIRVYVDSTNADRVMWNSETLELTIKFNDGSVYTYSDVSETIFNDVIDGKAKTKTAGIWGPKGKRPSVGAAIHKYLIERGFSYSRGGTFR